MLLFVLNKGKAWLEGKPSPARQNKTKTADLTWLEVLFAIAFIAFVNFLTGF